MRLSWQNLNDRSGWREGRAWLWLTRGGRAVVRFEWSHLKHPRLALRFALGAGDSDDLTIHVALLFGSWWLAFSHFLPWRWFAHEAPFGIETGFSLSGDFLQLMLFHEEVGWREKRTGWAKNFFLLDILLGPQRYREGAPTVTPILVPMPERSYRGTLTLRDDSWKRPRWFCRTVRRAHIEMDSGEHVPVPGKGESEYDCGEDGIYAMTTPARDAAEAVAKVVESAYRRRQRHGGLDWRPAAL